MEDFDVKRDFKFVKWKETLQVTVIRAVVAGFIWFVLSLVKGDQFQQALIMLVGFSAIYILCFLPIGLLCAFLSSKGVPFVGLITIFFALAIVLADPIVYAIHKVKPELVPVKKFGFINFALLIYVIDEDRQKSELSYA